MAGSSSSSVGTGVGVLTQPVSTNKRCRSVDGTFNSTFCISSLVEALDRLNKTTKSLGQTQCSDTDPRRMYNSFDKDTQSFLREWFCRARRQLEALEDQAALRYKYQELEAKNKLPHEFTEESRRNWQWTQEYIGIAEPISGLYEDDQYVEAAGAARSRGTPVPPFDLCKQFERMRLRHARECSRYITAHQKVAFEHYIAITSEEALQKSVTDEYLLWTSAKTMSGRVAAFLSFFDACFSLFSYAFP